MTRRNSIPTILQYRPVVYTKEESNTMKQINNYLLIEKIGSGASSKIYLAYDTKETTYVAVKLFKTSNGAKAGGLYQLDREVRNLSRFRHPNILIFREALFSREMDTAYLVLEYANSGSLSNYIKAHGTMEENKIACIYSQIVNAILYIHSNGVAHKDIKPDNILLCSNGTAKLSDFGIGHSFQSADSVVGSPAYQAPEIFGGDDDYDDYDDYIIDPIKEDVWSLGVSIYETAFGRLPFEGSNEFEIARSARENPLFIPSECSDKLKSLLSGMLSVKPESRLTMVEVSEHPFFKEQTNFEAVTFEALPTPSISSVLSDAANRTIEKISAENFFRSQLLKGKSSFPKAPRTLSLRPASLVV